MSESAQPAPAQPSSGVPAPEASVHRTRFSVIWIIPIVAVCIAGWLGWRAYVRRGPEITIEFATGGGLTAGQTKVEHKSVALGTVQGVVLSDDLKRVEVHVRMDRQSEPLLTDQARFWVVRPRLNGLNISGLETLLSGAYIAIDPGLSGGHPQTFFKGLDAPPGVRSDEPGRTYTLMTDNVGSIEEGSPMFFRDKVVGEVLNYTIPPSGIGPIPVQVFVRAPYDGFIHDDTRFWNVSGVQIEVGAGGFHLQVQSLQAVLSGGIAFGVPPQQEGKSTPEAPDNATFKLFASKSDADIAGYHNQSHFVTYLSSSVQGLAVGSPVDWFGFQIGNVTGIELQVDPVGGHARIRVSMDVQPERFLSEKMIADTPPLTALQAMVNNGLRDEVSSSSLITGSSVIAITFIPDAPPVKVTMEGDAIVLPSEAGAGLAGIEDSLSMLSTKLGKVPLDQIGQNLNSLLSHANDTVSDPDLKQSLHELNESMRSVRHLVAQADRGTTPLMQRLPDMTRKLQQAITNASETLGSYGGNSDFHHELDQLLAQLSDTATSLQTLADFLKRHPSSLVFGRNGP